MVRSQGSQSLALGLTLIAAPQLGEMFTSHIVAAIKSAMIL
jgi:hypothetical protein